MSDQELRLSKCMEFMHEARHKAMQVVPEQFLALDWLAVVQCELAAAIALAYLKAPDKFDEGQQILDSLAKQLTVGIEEWLDSLPVDPATGRKVYKPQ